MLRQTIWLLSLRNDSAFMIHVPHTLKSLSNRIAWRLYSSRYSRKCLHVGSGFCVKGSCYFDCAGEITFGDNVILDPSAGKRIQIRVGKAAKLSVGSNVYINYGVSITCNIEVTIGNGVLIAPEVMILDDDGHPTDWRRRHDFWPDGPETRLGAPIHIGDTVWLGARCILLKGVTIGEGSVVAAGAVVTNAVPPRTLVGGVPARVIRSLCERS